MNTIKLSTLWLWYSGHLKTYTQHNTTSTPTILSGYRHREQTMRIVPLLTFVLCTSVLAYEYEDCATVTSDNIIINVLCLKGKCVNSTCSCQSCPCYGLFSCTCNRGLGSCSSSCVASPRKTDCDVGYTDGERAAPVFMAAFLILSLLAVPTIVLCSTKCVTWRNTRISRLAGQQRAKEKEKKLEDIERRG